MELSLRNIETKIHTIRGVQVMLDSDLAEMYQTETKFINRAIKRNSDRFPVDFAFQLDDNEWNNLRYQSGTSSSAHGGRRYLPYALTEQGVAMLSSVLKTDVAVKISIQIMQAFVSMRRTLSNLQGVIQRLESVEMKQFQTESKLEIFLKALEKDTKPNHGIFFEGQLFDAHVFVSDLIKKAQISVLLVDNYVDEKTLLLLNKRNKGVKCYIHTRPNPTLTIDKDKHNKQYDHIELIENRSSHDRFLVIDDRYLYHIGASLKDLGNKCFAFSRMDQFLPEVQSKLLNN
jgi:phage regulator Rha-like protein